MFSFSLLWYSVCTLIMAFQSAALPINFWRFLGGIGLGVEMVTIDTYISEIAPKETRGEAFAFNEFVSFLAVPAAALISWLLLPLHVWGLDGWRWVAIIGASGAVFVWFIRRAIPESPRWLEQHGRTEEAARVMDDIEARVCAETGRELPPVELVEGETEQAAGSWMEMWRQPYRSRTILLIVFQVLQAVGYYGFASWVPTFLISQGIAVTKSLQYTFLMAIASPLGPLLGRSFADKFERKWQIAWTAFLIAACGLLFARQRSAVGVVLFGVLITLASNWMSFAFHAYQAELYPTRIRARAVGFVYSWSRFSAIVTSFVIAFILRSSGTAGVFLFIAGSMLMVSVLIGGFGPRTSRRRLEDIAP